MWQDAVCGEESYDRRPSDEEMCSAEWGGCLFNSSDINPTYFPVSVILYDGRLASNLWQAEVP